jgi:hypothetical protein
MPIVELGLNAPRIAEAFIWVVVESEEVASSVGGGSVKTTAAGGAWRRLRD